MSVTAPQAAKRYVMDSSADYVRGKQHAGFQWGVAATALYDHPYRRDRMGYCNPVPRPHASVPKMNQTILISIEGAVTIIVAEIVGALLITGIAPDPTTASGQHQIVLAVFGGILLGLKRLTASSSTATNNPSTNKAP
jgi:hypothetical protein